MIRGSLQRDNGDTRERWKVDDAIVFLTGHV